MWLPFQEQGAPKSSHRETCFCFQLFWVGALHAQYRVVTDVSSWIRGGPIFFLFLFGDRIFILLIFIVIAFGMRVLFEENWIGTLCSAELIFGFKVGVTADGGLYSCYLLVRSHSKVYRYLHKTERTSEMWIKNFLIKVEDIHWYLYTLLMEHSEWTYSFTKIARHQKCLISMKYKRKTFVTLHESSKM